MYQINPQTIPDEVKKDQSMTLTESPGPVRSLPERPGTFSPLGLHTQIKTAREVQRQGILMFFESTWRRDRDLARLQIGPQVIFLVVHPDHVRRITIEQRDTYGKEASYDDVRKLLLGEGLVG